jgi:hypothetical protein
MLTAAESGQDRAHSALSGARAEAPGSEEGPASVPRTQGLRSRAHMATDTDHEAMAAVL